MTPERIAELRAIIKEGVRTDRPMKNFMNIYEAANGLSDALDAIERVRNLCEMQAEMTPYSEEENGEKYAFAKVLDELEGQQ